MSNAPSSSRAKPLDALTVLRAAEAWARWEQTQPVPWLDDAFAVIAAADAASADAAAYAVISDRIAANLAANLAAVKKKLGACRDRG